MTFDEKQELNGALVTNLSIQNISDAVTSCCNRDAINTMRQAFVIAEGFVKAAKIRQDYERDKVMQRMKKVLSGIDPDAEFPEDVPDVFPEDEIQEFPEEE
jgi:hypothetical protein